MKHGGDLGTEVDHGFGMGGCEHLETHAWARDTRVGGVPGMAPEVAPDTWGQDVEGRDTEPGMVLGLRTHGERGLDTAEQVHGTGEEDTGACPCM